MRPTKKAGGFVPIISISVDNEILEELSSLEKSLGFSGRSDAIRTAIRLLISENKAAENISGEIKAVLLLVHDEKSDSCANRLKHAYDDVVSTQLHSNLKEGKCLEVFILEGKASRVREMFKAAQASKKIEYAKLVLP